MLYNPDNYKHTVKNINYADLYFMLNEYESLFLEIYPDIGAFLKILFCKNEKGEVWLSTNNIYYNENRVFFSCDEIELFLVDNNELNNLLKLAYNNVSKIQNMTENVIYCADVLFNKDNLIPSKIDKNQLLFSPNDKYYHIPSYLVQGKELGIIIYASIKNGKFSSSYSFDCEHFIVPETLFSMRYPSICKPITLPRRKPIQLWQVEHLKTILDNYGLDENILKAHKFNKDIVHNILEINRMLTSIYFQNTTQVTFNSMHISSCIEKDKSIIKNDHFGYRTIFNDTLLSFFDRNFYDTAKSVY